MKLKIGIGYDVHRLVENRAFFIGGIEIKDSPFGALGHSDADCLIHAIIDAMLGAAHLGDIGQNFPDNDDKYRDIDSKILLKRTFEMVSNKGFTISNIDSTICLQAPKLKDYIPKMQQCLAEILHLDIEDITIKATTTEYLGFTGRKEGIACMSVCLLQKD